MRYVLIAFLLSFCASVGFGTTTTNPDLSEFFRGHEGCFVLYATQTNSYIRYNSNACQERYSPCRRLMTEDRGWIMVEP
jgi:hypothetical protein